MGARGEMKEWVPIHPSGHHASLTLNDKVRMKDQTGTDTGMKLAANFVEFMMGYPIGYTDITKP
jgi:hypothetical protein